MNDINQSLTNYLRSTPVIQEGGGFHLLRSPLRQKLNSNTYTQKIIVCTYFANTIFSDTLLKIRHDFRE